MYDQANRDIHCLRLSLTESCNLRCCYCRPQEPAALPPQELTDAELLHLVQLFAACGIDTLRLTGGEPLLRKGCSDFIACLKQTEGVEQVTLTTNGTLLSQQLPALIAAGVDSINVSLDTLDAAYYAELTGGSLALVVRSRADRLARSVGPDTLPYPLLCDADGVLYDLLDIPTRSGALSTYSLEAWQIMRDAKRRGYHSPANGQQQLPLTLVLDKDGTVLFSHYGASLTDVPADCGAAQSLLEDLDVAKPVDVDDADVTIYADPGAAPDIPGLTPHVHEYAQPNLGETGVFSVFDDAYKDEE